MTIKIKQSGDGLWRWYVEGLSTIWEGGYPNYKAAYEAATNAAAGKKWEVAVIRVGG